ncbi:MAG: hypothetical protein H6906_02600, partial [Hyphomicrobiales bacterium]|nr:hypothetical protein [Hyphomicrobiales bacterium]
RLVAALGEKPYLVAFSALSIAVTVWLGYAFVAAPYVEVWPPTPWTRWVPLLAMPIACVLVVAGLTTPNPLSLGWGSAGWDPARPGIVAVTRHPAVWGLALWSAAHMPVNGDVAGLLLFGLLTLLALSGPASLDHKRRARLGEDRWRALAAGTSVWPLAAILAGRARTSAAEIGWARILGGLALYAVLLFGHGPVIGLDPLAF